MDEDAYVVGLSFFPPSLATSLTTKKVQMMAELAGVKLPKRQYLQRSLISLGHELYKYGKVELTKDAGLCREDVRFL